jgi:protein SCO1/2
MANTPRRTSLLLAVFALASTTPALAGEDPHAHCREAARAAGDAAPASASAVDVKLADAELLDQDGRPRRLAGDVIGDRLVVMSFVFTTCTTICPLISARLSQLQDRLGDRLGAEVRMVSLSIDPRRDTPARLKAFAARYGARPGWSHLTGAPDDVDQVLRGLGVSSATPAEHAPVTLLADGRTGRWYRLNGFPSPDQIVAQLAAMAAARRLAAAGPVAP